MANTLKIKRGTAATIPQGQLAEPLFTTDTYDFYIGKGAGGNQRIQNYIASGTSSQFLKGDGSLDSTVYQATSEKGQNNGYASLDSGGKVPIAQLPNSIIEYKGTWNASTNTPTLADGTGNTGDVYIVSVGGTQNLGSGSITFAAGDWVMYNGTIWEKSINSNAVASVNGQTGVVVLTTTNISEGTNLYYTDTRARTALSATSPVQYNNSTGVISILDASASQSGVVTTGTQTFAGAKTFSSNVTSTAFIPTGSTVPTNGMYLPSANTLGLSANSTKVIEISDSGRVSIGATSPTTDTLTVHGKLTTTNGGDITAGGQISSGSTISSGLNITATSTISGSALIPTGTTAPTVGMYLVSGTSTLNGVLGFSTNSTKRLEINNSTGDATFTNNISAANLSGTNTGDQTLAGLGGVPTSRTITINGTSFDLSANRTYTVGTIGGSGNSGYVSKFTGSTTIGNSLIYDNGVRAISVGNSSTNSWGSPFYVIEGGTYGGFLGFQTNAADVKFGVGAYWNGSNYVYTNTSIGFGLFNIGGDSTNGYLDFYGAPASTAGLTATPTKKFGIDNAGNGHFVESIGVGFTSGAPNGRIDFRNPANAIIVGKNTIGGTNTYSSIRLTTANSGGVGDSIGEIRGLSTNVNNRDTALTFLTSEGSAGQTEKMRITSGGNVGIGTTSPNYQLQVNSSTSISRIQLTNTSTGTTSGDGFQVIADGVNATLSLPETGYMSFETSNTERMRITSGGKVGIGLTDPSRLFQVKEAGTSTSGDVMAVRNDNTTSGAFINFIAGGANAPSIGAKGNDIIFTADGYAGTERMRITSGGNVLIGKTTNAGGRLQVSNGTNTFNVDHNADGPYLTGATDNNVNYRRLSYDATEHVFLTSATERMRITSGGVVNIGTTNDNPAENNVKGIAFYQDGRQFISSDNNEVMRINRKTSDGVLVYFHQDGVAEGNISVSGTTVSYNGGHLARYSQTESGHRVEGLLKGTVMSNLDKMAEWINPETGQPYANEQLNCMKVSDVEGDINIAGVFVNWDEDDKTFTNDMNIAMTGDMIIRIAKDVVVQRGQLLMSAGDGTAKPQGDDIIRDKTIAKVTSNHVTCVYEDGSYCVPCVLMAC